MSVVYGRTVDGEREILTWELFGTASRELAQLIADDGYEPEMILSIARGGLLVGGALGYALGVKNVYTMNVEYYTGVDERLDVPRILPPAPDFVDLDDARILIADDVSTRATRFRACRRSARARSVKCGWPFWPRSLRRSSPRLLVASDRPVDQLPLERKGSPWRCGRGDARRLSVSRPPHVGARRLHGCGLRDEAELREDFQPVEVECSSAIFPSCTRWSWTHARSPRRFVGGMSPSGEARTPVWCR